MKPQKHKEFEKIDAAMQVKHYQYQFSRNPRLICPYCGRMFRHERMWQIIVEKFDSIQDIAKKMKYPWEVTRLMIRKYGLELNVKSSADRRTLERLAKKAGYFNLEDMIFDLRVSRGYNYKKIGELLGVARSVARALVLNLLEPKNRRGIKRVRKNLGGTIQKYPGDIKYIEEDLKKFREGERNGNYPRKKEQAKKEETEDD